MATDAVAEARKVLGRKLRGFREASGYTQQELAGLLGYSRPRVAGAERGDSCSELFWQGCDKLLNAGGALTYSYQEIEKIRRAEAREVAETERIERALRTVPLPRGDSNTVGELAGFSARSHKFIAAFVGVEAAQRAISACDARVADDSHWISCRSAPYAHSSGQCELHIWPFGVAIFHLVEDLTMPNIASLALWRMRSYAENLAWATTNLRQLTGAEDVSASYVLSAYWVTEPEWAHGQLDDALRTICTPRILLQRESRLLESDRGEAERAERRVLASGHDGSGIEPFGLSGVSIGYAAWSGVVYHPISPNQALAEGDLVACELATQAVWAYCEYINRQIEFGIDPVLPDVHGWRFLRGARSRLVNPRPQETGQHRSMRDAIVRTSGLLEHLDQAIDIARQSQS
ncbi:helix-turn-helix domain-containing protein [Actinomadura sp. BRA 177]|uniref:helix-turn-helix domain-containing protein n=1 Tax=Actinomadura sp. BRA 177 TaxID=2745202 RepID=UPI001595645C|nr:transcriptional regulator [Actinomadura sp. BRA 177]NVI91392.1 transcriptional regulator [Actinomadura sp. BRA 177]